MATILPLGLIFGMSTQTGQAILMTAYMLFIFAVAPYVLWSWSRRVAYQSLRHGPEQPGFA
jgi:hypothetical protein